MDLAAAVAPTTLARQRTLPVSDPLVPLLPDGALARGRAVSCRGIAATSLATALAAEATAAGAWLAVVDVPWLGVEAAAELGVPLERLVRVDRGDTQWADLVAAVLDGFELVITRVPRRLNAATLRRVQTRVQAREAVLIVVGDTGGATCAGGGSPCPRPAAASLARDGRSCGSQVPTARSPWPSRCCDTWGDVMAFPGHNTCSLRRCWPLTRWCSLARMLERVNR